MIAGRRATEERVYSDNLVIESQDERSVSHSCQAQMSLMSLEVRVVDQMGALPVSLCPDLDIFCVGAILFVAYYKGLSER